MELESPAPAHLCIRCQTNERDPDPVDKTEKDLCRECLGKGIQVRFGAAPLATTHLEEVV